MEQAVLTAFDTPDLVREFNRLRGTALPYRGGPSASHVTERDALKFIRFVRHDILGRLPPRGGPPAAPPPNDPPSYGVLCEPAYPGSDTGRWARVRRPRRGDPTA